MRPQRSRTFLWKRIRSSITGNERSGCASTGGKAEDDIPSQLECLLHTSDLLGMNGYGGMRPIRCPSLVSSGASSLLLGGELTFLFPSLSFQTADEGSTVSCVIERVRGSLDHVYVNYSVTQLDSSSSETPAHQDFVNATGAVLFLPGQRSEVRALCSLYR